jgi:hypothetical protein
VLGKNTSLLALLDQTVRNSSCSRQYLI